MLPLATRGAIMSSEDTEYYRRRAIEEAALAKGATCEVTAAVHGELALRYQALVDEAEGRVSDAPPAPAQNVNPRAKSGVLWAG